MKTVLIVMLSLTCWLGASAQRKGGYYHVYTPRVVVAPTVGFGFGYGYGYPYFGSPYFGYPYYGYRNMNGYGNSSKLNLQIQSITLNYKNQIKEVRHDKSLTHRERRAQIRNLKNEKEQAIITAQENYRNGRMNNQYRGGNNNGNGNQNNQTPPAGNQNNQNGNNTNTSVMTNS